MNPFVLLSGGAFLLFFSFSYHFRGMETIDGQFFNILHHELRRPPWRQLFRTLWLVGRTEFLILVIACCAIFNLRMGISATIAYLFWGFMDQLIKKKHEKKKAFRLPTRGRDAPTQATQGSILPQRRCLSHLVFDDHRFSILPFTALGARDPGLVGVMCQYRENSHGGPLPIGCAGRRRDGNSSCWPWFVDLSGGYLPDDQ